MDNIVVHFSSAGLWGGADQGEGNIDAAESAKKFTSLLEAKLKERYPNTMVRIIQGSQDRFTVDGRSEGYDNVAVGEIINRLMKSRDWVVSK